MDGNATQDGQRNGITASLPEIALDLRNCWEHTADPL
jgi:starch phosphorylase